MARAARPSIGRRIRLAVGGAVAVTALTVSTAAALPPIQGEMQATASSPRTPSPGFLLDKGRYTTFDVPGARVGTSPLGINNRGQIIGKYNDGTTGAGAGASEHGFVRDRSGRFSRIDVPGARATTTTRMNDHGQIVGIYSRTFGRVGDDPNRRGFLLQRGRFTWIDVPGAAYTQPLGINNRGQLVGEYRDGAGTFHGFLWQKGRFTTIDVPGSTAANAAAINDRGQVVGLHGDAANPTAIHGYLLDEGRYRSFDAPGVPSTIPLGINDRGQVVGFTISSAGVLHGFLLVKGVNGPFTPVDVPGAPSSGAGGINDRGQIVGSYSNPAAMPPSSQVAGVQTPTRMS